LRTAFNIAVFIEACSNNIVFANVCPAEGKNNEKNGKNRKGEGEAGRNGREINGEQSQEQKMSKCGDRISISWSRR